jgi:Domain of unknown function (DUF4129)
VVIPAASLATTRLPTSALRAVPTGGIPLASRQAAQRLARAELAKAIYHPQPSLTARVLHAAGLWLGRVFRASQELPGGWWAIVTLTAVAVVVVAIVRARIGPVARARRRARELGGPARALTASDHRSAAAGLAGAGDFAGAICERVRAIAAELDERGVLRPLTGRTADEFAAEAGQALPPYAADLRGAALLFDEVRYGQRAGSRPGYERVTELDARIRASAGRAAPVAPPAPATADGALP